MSNLARISFFYVGWCSLIGATLPTFRLWLEDARGIGDWQAGLILGVPLLFRVLTSPFIAAWAEGLQRRKTALVILAALTFFSYLSVLISYSFWALIVTVTLSQIFFQALIPLTDAATAIQARRDSFSYGIPRAFGSATFIMAGLMASLIISQTGTETVIYVVLFACSLLFIAGLQLPPMIKENPDNHSSYFRDLSKAFSLFVKNRLLWMGLVAAALIQGSHGLYYGFATDIWRESGLSEAVAIRIFVFGVVVEILFLVSYARFNKLLTPERLIIFAALGAMLRWTGFGFASSLVPLLLLQSLHALTFAAAHVGAVHLIEREIPESHAASLQTIYATLSGGVMLGLSMGMAGYLKLEFGAQGYFFMALFALAALILMANNIRREAQK